MQTLKRNNTDATGLDELDLDSAEVRSAQHFRRIIAARKGVELAEAELRNAVMDAREAGDSWTVIGSALETTRQAACQRFGVRKTSNGKES